MTKLLHYACVLLFIAFVPIFSQAQCVVNAGADQTLCFAPEYSLVASSATGNYSSYVWTTSGTGTFTASTQLSSYYMLSEADVAAGSVTLTLTGTSVACGSSSDSRTITVLQRPIVSAGVDQTICGSIVSLSGTVTPSSGMTLAWFNVVGSGTFSNTTTLTPTYTLTAADQTRGYALVRLKATSSTGCTSEDTVQVTVAANGPIDVGPDETICATASTIVTSNATAMPGYASFLWTTSGTGTFSNSASLLSNYFLSAADVAAGSVTLTLTGSSACGSGADSRIITFIPGPVVSAGADQSICGNTAALNGTITPSSAVTFEWFNVIGSGTFSNTTTLTPIYTVTAADQTRGYALVRLSATANTGCIIEDTVQITIVESASLNAGTDQTTCAAAGAIINSDASSTPGYISYAWTTSGTGTFINSTTLSSPYIFSAADVVAGSVTLTLTGTTVCGSTSDTRTITVVQSPIVSAGVDQNICGSTTAALNGTVTPSAGVTLEWFNVIGSGTFSSTTTLTPIYTTTVADRTRGYVLVRLKAVSSTGCTDEDTVRLNVAATPIVSAGSNQVSCSGAITVRGYAFNATSKVWSTSGTGTFANPSKDTTTYAPSAADRASGQVTLTYTGTNTCSTINSTMIITFIQAPPQINAGYDETICVRDTLQLIGSVSYASGAVWTTSGTGSFVLSPSHLVNLYRLSAADKMAGSVSFTLTSYSSGGCAAVSEVKTITLLSGTPPNVYAGADQVSSISTPLNATVSNATGQLWQTSGVGVFTPNPTSVNASYIPSAADIAAGSVELTLSATNSCGSASDALTLFTATPSSISGTVKAGANTLDRGVVYLFSTGTQGRKLEGIDTISLSNNGVYEFSSVAAGNYTVYAVPLTSSSYAATYLATYLGSATATEWRNAGQMEIPNGSAAHVLNVDLEAYTSALQNWNTGVDTISGAVFLTIPIMMRLSGSNDKPLAGVVVYLKTVSGQVIAYTSTDKYGMYSFNNVLSGNYIIDPEYPRTMTTFYAQIAAVDGNPQTVEDGNVFVIDMSFVTGILSSNKSTQINVYPNPTADNVQMQLPKTGNYSVKVLDETGVVHIEQQLSVTSGVAAELSLAGLNKGLYIIQITSGDEVYNTKVVKF